jgi:foldase protein PrsA
VVLLADKTNAKKQSKKERNKKKKEEVKEELAVTSEVKEGEVTHEDVKKKREEIKELATTTEGLQEKQKEIEQKEKNKEVFQVNPDSKSSDNKEDIKEEEPFEHENFEEREEVSSPNKVVIFGAIIAIVLITLIIINIDRIIPPTSKSDLGNIVAEINGRPVTEEEFDKYYNFYFFVRGYPEQYKQTLTRTMILNETLVNEKLLLQKAQEEGIIVTEEKVDAVLNETLQRLPVAKEEFEKTLAEKGFTLDDLREYYRTQLVIMALLNSSVTQEITISDEEAEEYYGNNIPMFKAGEGEIRLRHILVNSGEEAEKILKELEDGADFTELAKEKSIDTSASRGGELGFIGKGTTVQEFEEAAFELKEGEVSGIVETQFGYHIIKREPDIVPLEEVKDKIKQALLNREKQNAVREYIERLRAESDIKISLEEENLSELLKGVIPEVGNTFRDTGDDLCEEDGKPIIRLFSTTWCPHCKWIKDTYDSVVKEYIGSGKIVAYHWQLDTGDDTLTKDVENEVPSSESSVYKKYNPDGSVPTFIFGCKYMRIGNGYETQGDLKAEEAEFRKIIEELIEEESVEETLLAEEQGEEVSEEEVVIEEKGKECIVKYGLTSDTVVFYYADWCSSCKEVKENVEKLQSKGYNFKMVESGEADIIKHCFKEVNLVKVPQLICADDGSTAGGSLTESQLKEFAEGCG